MYKTKCDTLKQGNHGITLTLLQHDQLPAWKEYQSSATNNWLKATGYNGKGLCILPAEVCGSQDSTGKTQASDTGNGNTFRAIYCVEDIHDPFICGELPEKLPADEYVLELFTTESKQQTLLRSAAFSWGLGSYRFTRYKTADVEKKLATLVLEDQQLIDEVNRTLSAVYLVRDLINTPAQDMMPQHIGQAMEALAEEFGASVTQIVGDELLEQNYATIHAVGRASKHPPRLIDLRWGDASHPKLTLVGKGICFDSGGLDIKPAAFMRLMKKDMGGAANILGLASLIMSNKLPVNLRVLIPTAENAISGDAFRPGDVITSRKGITVEIDNTDAEGRLVLCDALAEASSEKPDLLIDFATLTGANTAALGPELPGIYSDNRAVTFELAALGDTVGDPVWPMPMFNAYDKYLKSGVADVCHMATGLPTAGNIVAALYLKRFVDEPQNWLHVDFYAWNYTAQPGRPVGGEALGIRTMFAYFQQRFGKA